LALDDKYDDIKKLIDTGKEKGYLTYDQVNDLIPHDVHSPEDLDDLLTTIGTQGIDVLEGPKLPSAALDKKFEDIEEGRGRRTRPHSRRAGKNQRSRPHVSCARWGRCLCSRAKAKWKSPSASSAANCACSRRLSRSPIVIHELLAMGEDLKKGVRSIKEVVTFDEEEITDEILQNRLNEFTGKIDNMAKLYKKVRSRREIRGGFAEEAAEGSSPRPPQPGSRHRAVSKAVRKLGFTNAERKRLIDRLNKTVDGMRSLDRQAEISSARPTPRAAKNRRKNTGGSRAPSAAKLKNSNSKPACCSRSSSARSARSSRATWTRSRPSAS
jgi:RNA polymerase primary sigma factor